MACFTQRLFSKVASLPAVNVVHIGFLHQFIVANLGQEDGPNQPVDTSGENDAEADNAMDPVRQALVYALTLLRRNEWGHDEVNVAEEVEDGDGQSGPDGRVPVPRGLVAIQVNQGSGNKDIDDGEGVRNEVEHKVVSVASRRGQDSNGCDQPVFKEAGQRRIEGPVAGEEARKGEDASSAELLNQTALGEDDAEQSAEGGRGGKECRSRFWRRP